jgi:CRP-like cAMP-binding protein
MATRTEFLSNVRILADLDAGEVQALLARLHPHELEAGEVLFREGDPGEELFVVESGTLGISVSLADGQSLEIASFEAGDFFGEMSIFEREPRSATCQAKSPCRLLSLRRQDLFEFMTRSPASAARIMRRMLAPRRYR